MFGTVQQMAKPSANLGDHEKSEEPHPCVAVKPFFERLQTVIADTCQWFFSRGEQEWLVAIFNFFLQNRKGRVEDRIPLHEHRSFKHWNQNNGRWRRREQGPNRHCGQRAQFGNQKLYKGGRSRKETSDRNRPYF